jgi:hypothetical protein
MPILAGLATPPAPELYIEDVGYAVATWYAPDGSVWPLMNEDLGWLTLAEGITGLDAEALTITTDKRRRGGVRVRHIQPEQRVITWPLEVFSDSSHVEFVARWRQVMNAFVQTTELGPGWLEIARPDGSARRVACYYQDGFEGARGLGVLSDRVVITLLCEDPYWQDAVATVIGREYSQGAPFLNPFPKISAAHVLGETTIANPGDVIAWPYWQVTGPASGLTAQLHTTGESFVLTPSATPHGNLLAGEQATIRTDPPQIRGPGNQVWTGALNWPGAVLWGLPKGEHDVKVELRFFPRYRSA